jgi:hypothetical protein
MAKNGEIRTTVSLRQAESTSSGARSGKGRGRAELSSLRNVPNPSLSAMEKLSSAFGGLDCFP